MFSRAYDLKEELPEEHHLKLELPCMADAKPQKAGEREADLFSHSLNKLTVGHQLKEWEPTWSTVLTFAANGRGTVVNTYCTDFLLMFLTSDCHAKTSNWNCRGNLKLELFQQCTVVSSFTKEKERHLSLQLNLWIGKIFTTERVDLHVSVVGKKTMLKDKKNSTNQR